MTLVVLKIVLASYDQKKKIAYAKATLAFEDNNVRTTNGKNEPLVEAWAPFHAQQGWNPGVAHFKKTDTKAGKLAAGNSGVNLSAGSSSQGEISWDRTSFDQGRSNTVTRRQAVLPGSGTESHGS
jgi:hypothetical protein